MACDNAHGMRSGDDRPLTSRLRAACIRAVGSVVRYPADLLLLSRQDHDRRRGPLSLALFIGGGAALCISFGTILAEIGYRWYVPHTGFELPEVPSLALFACLCGLCLLVDYMARLRDGRGVGPLIGILSASQAIGLISLPVVGERPATAVACVALSLGLTAGMAWVRRSRLGRGPEAWATSAIALYCLAACSFALAAYVRYEPVYATSAIDIPAGVADTLDDAASTANEELDLEPISEQNDQTLVDLGQRYAHVEAARLGIAEPEVVMGDAAGVRGFFRHRANQLVLCRSGMVQQNESDFLILATTICHEMAHAYQYAVLDGAVDYDERTPFGDIGADEVERWRAEFEEGVDPTQEPERYAALANEQRAVQYAGDEVVEFMRVLVSKPWL